MTRALACVTAVAVLLAGCGDAPKPKPRPAEAAGVREQRVGPRVLDLTIRSAALGRRAHVRLLLPEGWKRHGRRWPVLYLLHGCCDTYRAWTRSTDIETWPELRHTLVVMPEGGAVGYYVRWRGGRPDWPRFHLGELRTLLEHDYGAGEDRAIAGLSMGGYGAMTYAARRPHLFRAAASFSGQVHPLRRPSFLDGLLRSQGADPHAVPWRRTDPTATARRLRGVRLYVASGAGPHDVIEREVGRESRDFVAGLRRLRIPMRAHLYPGGRHDWPYWQRELRRALPVLTGRGSHGES